MRYAFTLDGRTHHVTLEEHAEGPRFVIDGESFDPQVEKIGKGRYAVRLGDQSYEFGVENGIVHEGPHVLDVQIRRAKPLLQRVAGAGARGDGRIKPPMPGKIIEVPVKEGDTVTEGQTLLVLEAMKMQNDIKSPFAGIVKRILVQAGSNVEVGTVLVELDQEAEA